MKPKTIETLTWVLIYGGVLLLSLSAFVRERSPGLGAVLAVAGGVAAAVGIALIVVRSRMKTSDTPARKDTR